MDVHDETWRQFNINCLCKWQFCDAGDLFLNTTGDVVNSSTAQLDSVILQYGQPIFLISLTKIGIKIWIFEDVLSLNKLNS